jgi:Mg2+/citrate symporter
MFIFLSLTFLGSATAPLPIGVSSGLGSKVNPWVVFSYRMSALLAGFVVSLVFAFIFDRILSSLKPFGIDLDDVDKSHDATGIYVMGYVIFLGVILYASLLLPI